MWIDKINEKKIKKPYSIENEPMQIWEDESKLNSLGIYKAIVLSNTANKRYYNVTESVDYDAATISYTAVEKSLDEVKTRMKGSVKDTFIAKQKSPVVDTGLGYSVDGGYDKIKDFEVGKKHAFPQIRDSDNIFHSVTDVDYDTIITAIETYGIILFQTKWTKEAEIDALVDLEACKLYEATPYEYTYTQEDVDAMPEDSGIVVGDVVTRYRNNCTEWQVI